MSWASEPVAITPRSGEQRVNSNNNDSYHPSGPLRIQDVVEKTAMHHRHQWLTGGVEAGDMASSSVTYTSVRPFLYTSQNPRYLASVQPERCLEPPRQVIESSTEIPQVQMENNIADCQDLSSVEDLVRMVVDGGFSGIDATNIDTMDDLNSISREVECFQDVEKANTAQQQFTNQTPMDTKHQRDPRANPHAQEVGTSHRDNEQDGRAVKKSESKKKERRSHHSRKRRPRSSSSSSSDSDSGGKRKKHSSKTRKTADRKVTRSDSKKTSSKSEEDRVPQLCVHEQSGKEKSVKRAVSETLTADTSSPVLNSPAPAKAKVNPKTSTNRAASSVSTAIKNTGKQVMFEDGNIVVYQDLYSVVFKNASDVFKTINAQVNETLEVAKKKLASLIEEKIERFHTKVDHLTKQKLNQIQRVAPTKQTDQYEDDHKFVIITPKPKNCTFRFVTASDDHDMQKKMVRYRRVDRLLLEFDEHSEFNVKSFRNVLKSNKLTAKGKNDFSFNGNGVKDLQDFLIEIINHSSSSNDNPDAKGYSLTYIRAEKGSSTNHKTDGPKKQVRKKDAVRRSRNEEHTDNEQENSVVNNADSDNSEDSVATDYVSITDQEDGRPMKNERTPTVSKKHTSKRKRADVDDSPSEEDYYERDARGTKDKPSNNKRLRSKDN